MVQVNPSLGTYIPSTVGSSPTGGTTFAELEVGYGLRLDSVPNVEFD